MFNPQQLEGLAEKVLGAIPEGFGAAPEQIKQQIKAVLQNALQEMDLVTRDEFEVQTQVLAKTRAKLEELTKLVEQLSEK